MEAYDETRNPSLHGSLASYLKSSNYALTHWVTYNTTESPLWDGGIERYSEP